MARQSLYEFKRDGILQAIDTLATAKGRPPSLREIAVVADISIATLHSYLTKMKKEGLVEWDQKHHRSLRVLGSLQPGAGLGMSVPSLSSP